MKQLILSLVAIAFALPTMAKTKSIELPGGAKDIQVVKSGIRTMKMYKEVNCVDDGIDYECDYEAYKVTRYVVKIEYGLASGLDCGEDDFGNGNCSETIYFDPSEVSANSVPTLSAKTITKQVQDVFSTACDKYPYDEDLSERIPGCTADYITVKKTRLYITVL